MSSGAVHGYPESAMVANATQANLYRAQKMHTDNNEVVLAEANSDMSIGFNQTITTAANQPIHVKVAGFTLASSDAGWTRGDKLTPTTGGQLVTTTTAGHLVCAIAQDTVATDELGEVLIVSPAIRYDGF